MTITKQFPQKEYPYLAVWVGTPQIEPLNLSSIKNEDIVLISMVEVEKGEDKQTYIQFVLGGKPSYTTKNENEYCPLPTGYVLTLCQ